MDKCITWTAQKIVLALGWLTFVTLNTFKKLGADMASVDETLASWTAWSQDIKTKLADALATNEQLVATDAEQDAAQAAALQEEFAAKVQAAYDTAVAPPELPAEPSE